MITKNHPSAYAELFKKAQEALKNYGSTQTFRDAKITNIDDYFSCLAELARIESDPEVAKTEIIDPIFTILPTTEETFDIDANTRKIMIPDNFAKYGVGVQGDEIAEILYFSIDRYFDAMDLAEMDIIIQWRHEKDADTSESLSATYKKSLTLQPGKIVFGWPITSEITSRPGSVQFSIRFYRREDVNNTKQLVYSFSTLPATVKIQSGLQFDLTDYTLNGAINKSQTIYSNLRNSKKATLDYIVAAPTFTNYYMVDDNNKLNNLTQYNNHDLPITFAVKAEIAKTTPEDYQISGAGISYSWHEEKSPSTDLISSYIYRSVDTLTEVYNPKEIYYYINTEGEYSPYYITGDDNPFNDKKELYVRCSKFIPTAAGKYYAIAHNIYAPGAEARVASSILEVPGPDDIIFNMASNKAVLNDSGEVVLTISALVGDKDITEGRWYHNATSAHFDTAETISDIEISENNEYSYTAEEEGYYFLKLTNTRNNTVKEAASNAIWVRHQASTPVVVLTQSIKDDKPELSADIDPASPLTYTDGLSTLTYQWYCMAATGEWTVIPNATNAILSNADYGRTYSCVITNHYKETQSSNTIGSSSIVTTLIN